MCNISIKKFLYLFGVMSYSLGIFGVIVIPVLTYLNYLKISRYAFAVALVLCITAVVCLSLSKYKVCEKVSIQFFVVYVCVLIFFCCAIVNIIKYQTFVVKYIVALEFGATIGGLIYWGNKINFARVGLFIKNWFIQNKILVFFLIIWIALNIETLRSWINWDSEQYYKAIANSKLFSLSPNDVVMFKAAGHSSYGFMFFSFIGETLIPNHGIGVRVISQLMLLATFILLNSILKKLIPESNEKVNLLCVIIFALTPVIMGPLNEIHVEYALLFFFVLFYWSYINRLRVLEIASGIGLVFSKENGIILLVSFALGLVIAMFVKAIKEKDLGEIFGLIALKEIICVYLPAFIFLIYFVLDGGGWSNNARVDDIQGQLWHSFGINSLHIVNKLKQLFVLNFQWLIILVIIVALICIIAKKSKIGISSYHILPVFCSGIAVSIFQIAYITYSFPRYIIIQYFFSILVFSIIINTVNWKKSLKTLMAWAIIILLIVENYVTIDIFTLKCFNKVDIGETYIASNNKLLSLGSNTIVVDDNNCMILSPYACYNRQYTYRYKMMDEVFKAIDYSDNDLIILPDLFSPISGGSYWGYVPTNYYSNKEGAVYQVYEPDNESNDIFVNYRIVKEDDFIEIEQYDNVYYIQFPYMPEYNDSLFLDKYEICDTNKINYKGWEAVVYKIKE